VTSAIALADAADALSPPYRLVPSGVRDMVLLHDDADALPELRLSLQRERRLFSRTMAMVFSSSVGGVGPRHDGEAELRKSAIGRPSTLRWRSAPDPSRLGARDGDGAIERFQRAGLLDGVARMTSVQRLTIGWGASESTWRLRLESLAGAIIGTGPSLPTAVPLEDDDVQGLLQILRALTAATRGRR
jgi:hypothetical protein